MLIQTSVRDTLLHTDVIPIFALSSAVIIYYSLSESIKHVHFSRKSETDFSWAPETDRSPGSIDRCDRINGLLPRVCINLFEHGRGPYNRMVHDTRGAVGLPSRRVMNQCPQARTSFSTPASAPSSNSRALCNRSFDALAIHAESLSARFCQFGRA